MGDHRSVSEDSRAHREPAGSGLRAGRRRDRPRVHHRLADQPGQAAAPARDVPAAKARRLFALSSHARPRTIGASCRPSTASEAACRATARQAAQEVVPARAAGHRWSPRCSSRCSSRRSWCRRSTSRPGRWRTPCSSTTGCWSTSSPTSPTRSTAATSSSSATRAAGCPAEQTATRGVRARPIRDGAGLRRPRAVRRAREDLIKRVIGVGGDTVVCCDEPEPHHRQRRAARRAVPVPRRQRRRRRTTFNVTVPQGRLWVMGDHRVGVRGQPRPPRGPGRGFVPVDDVIGRAFARRLAARPGRLAAATRHVRPAEAAAAPALTVVPLVP